jgi:hypothetical protein
MANVAFGVRQTANGIGTTDTDIRHMLAQKWLNKGVVGGLNVSGGSTMAYNVSAGMAICSRGVSDGFTEAYWSGGATPTVEANSSPNPRIDVVWITAHDMSQGDADNLVKIGVTKGTAAARPSAPTIPTYATEVAQMLLPGGATTTKNATVNASISFAIPYGASLGMLGDTIDTRDQIGDSVVNKYYVEMHTNLRYLPTDRLVELRFQVCASASDQNYSDWYQSFVVDGEEVANSGGEFHFTNGWSTQERSHIMQLEKGNHIVAVRTGLRGGSAPRFHYSGDKYTSFYGRRLQVFDRGVVR